MFSKRSTIMNLVCYSRMHDVKAHRLIFLLASGKPSPKGDD